MGCPWLAVFPAAAAKIGSCSLKIAQPAEERGGGGEMKGRGELWLIFSSCSCSVPPFSTAVLCVSPGHTAHLLQSVRWVQPYQCVSVAVSKRMPDSRCTGCCPYLLVRGCRCPSWLCMQNPSVYQQPRRLCLHMYVRKDCWKRGGGNPADVSRGNPKGWECNKKETLWLVQT